MAGSDKVRLGETEVARIGLGTNRLRHTQENVNFVREAVEAGVELIDTANVYADGESEATIGEALASSGNGCLVATKGGYANGASPDTLSAEIEESLRRLQTDAIDLYYLHKPDPGTPLEESLATIEEHRRQGVVKSVGVSNVSLEELEKAREATEIAAVQNHYNLGERSSDDVVDYCAENDIVFVPYFPLKESSPAVEEVAGRKGASGSQVILAWLLERSSTTLPIPGTLSIEHVRENLEALRLELSDEEIAALG